MTECPTCGQDWPGGLVWKVDHGEEMFSASVTDGKNAGWALQKTEQLARSKALARMCYQRDYLS
jgi:hypothetical protein